MLNPKNENRFLFNQVRPYRYVIVAIVCFALAGSLFDGISIGLLVPLLGSLQGIGAKTDNHALTRWLPDALHQYSLEQQILIAVLFVTLAMILKNATLAISIWLGTWLSTRVSANLRSEAINLLMSVDIDFHRRAKLGELMASAHNAPNQAREIVLTLVHLVADIITFTVLIGLMFILSWQLSLISLLLGLSYLGLMFFHMRKLAASSQEKVKLHLRTSHQLQESLAGIELIKAYGREPTTVKKLHELIDRSRLLQASIVFRSNATIWMTDILGAIAIAIFCLAAIVLFDMSSGVLISRLLPFLYIITRLVPIARTIFHHKSQLVTNWPSFKLVYQLLRTDNKPFLADGLKTFNGLQHAIHFQNVSFSYQAKEKFALSKLNFSIPKGKTTAFVGQSGCGKTTIINLLMRFYDPNDGEILIDDQPLANFCLETYRSKISVVSQETFIFHDTVKSNIAFGLDTPPNEDEIIQASCKAGAHEFIMKLSKGYDTVVGDRGVQLSGGQRQRISIARAIIRDPEILILDEATSAMDNLTEQDIHQAILDFSQNRTVVIIAHRFSTIQHAAQVIVMNNGRIIEIGSRKQLEQLGGEYNRLAHQ